MKRTNTIAIPKKALLSRGVFTFDTKVAGKTIHGLIVKTDGGRYYAYQNLCKHVPVTLDCTQGDITTIDGKKIQCQMHGAIYEMATGECTSGPCVGSRLNRFELLDEGEKLVVLLPNLPEIT